MRNVLSRINILNLLVCRSISKSSRNRLISWFDRNDINISEEKSRREKIIKRKSIRDNNVVKIIQINNAFSINMLMFCDSENKSKSSILSLFVKSKNIKSWLAFLFFDVYFSVWFANFYIIRLKITSVIQTIIAFKT